MGVDAAAPRPGVTRDAVLDTALTLFAQRGYHGTPLSDVADALGIRTPSLYNHMGSKQDLLATILLRTMDDVLADFRSAVAGREAPADRLRAATRIYALRHATHRREALVVNRDATSVDDPERGLVRERRREHERAVRAIIAEGVRTGEFVAGNPALASFAILEMSVSIARWFSDDGPRTAEQVADEHAEYALRIVRYRP
ncbi:MAG: TetR/AcrR family transcriptional regulator [Actinomycetota bacterium]|nr:TetR/AcrR family transcriptional regulator [Actinomycetota bacterium]